MIIQEQQERWLMRVEDMFFRYGIRVTTMDEVAKTLGISKKTLYHFFPTKHDLVEQVMQRFVGQERETIKAMRAKSENALDEIVLIAGHNLTKTQCISIGTVLEIQRFYNSAWDIMLRHKQSDLLEAVKANLHRGIEEGLYRADIEVELTARLHIVQGFSIFDLEWFPPELYPLSQVFKQYFDLYLYALLTEKGREVYAAKVGGNISF